MRNGHNGSCVSRDVDCRSQFRDSQVIDIHRPPNSEVGLRVLCCIVISPNSAAFTKFVPASLSIEPRYKSSFVKPRSSMIASTTAGSFLSAVLHPCIISSRFSNFVIFNIYFFSCALSWPLSFSSSSSSSRTFLIVDCASAATCLLFLCY